MTAKRNAHVVLNGSTFECLHCGDSYEMQLPAPLDVMTAAMKAFNTTHGACKEGAAGLACTFCLKFSHDETTCPRLAYGGDPEQWLAGPDTGISSRAICARLRGGLPSAAPSGNTPRDPADFGRCHRLLHAIPGWRARIGEMAAVPGWEKLAQHWDELEALYVEELPTGKGPKLYARMRELEELERAAP